MDSIIETQRQAHEEIESYEQALAEVLMQNPTTRRNITRRDRKAAEILDRIVQLRQDLVNEYEDLPGLRPTELALLSAPPAGEDDLAEFYVRFEKIKEFHHKNRNINARQFINELDELVKGDGMTAIPTEDGEPIIVDSLDSVFSGEEAYGKHLDLYYSHTQYLNLKGAVRLSYIAYIDMLRQGKVERTLDVREKSNAQYLEYVATLYNYLVSFFERALPLENVHGDLEAWETSFSSAWTAGQVEGWSEGSSSSAGSEGIWCPYCAKSYSKQTVYDAHLSSAKHKKKEKEGKKESNPQQSSNGSSTSDKHRPPARFTYMISKLLTHPPIPQLLVDSRSEVERRMALTAKEREAELEEADEAPPPPAEIEDVEEEEDDDGRIYNPKGYPLGWDGKPIPTWLWKLHGLGMTFDCEICSEATYQGRKAFDRHFQEAKHAFGMRALGLPNTKHFHGITKIAEALAVAEKLKREGRAELAALEKAEEVEDADGNVYSKSTYEQLKKQGVL
ncbi:hypothetical protein BD324DRAFT_629158 [Kockovaella imperatae]|uniref:C2H2-type domain-containing protein n=1 Tax=Kockovaella imperatae TaxID=4999 RepID=A0A1Y1UER6_9TREE|nr:hypothetical protein BD324DRAFT_629158 [Kockovaella imperatae]ORX36512.1 hypothetical protein BD324DRAFT_629158 [Kockovaella imperatae]